MTRLDAHADPIPRYLAGIETLHAAVAGLSAAQLRARPVPGTWSSLEAVCHLADAEVLFADRMKRMLVEERPALVFVDPNRYLAALLCEERDVSEELALIAAVRRQMARILRAQPPAAWRRVGIHNKEGERTLKQLLQKAVDHLDHHLTFLAAKRAALTENA